MFAEVRFFLTRVLTTTDEGIGDPTGASWRKHQCSFPRRLNNADKGFAPYAESFDLKFFIFQKSWKSDGNWEVIA